MYPEPSLRNIYLREGCLSKNKNKPKISKKKVIEFIINFPIKQFTE